MTAETSNPGVTTDQLDQICHDYIVNVQQAIPLMGYLGFPKTVCIVVNYVICHGHSVDKPLLKDGDIVNIDGGHWRWLVRRHQPHVLCGSAQLAQRLVRTTY
jgi:methionyl aminopeptidase